MSASMWEFYDDTMKKADPRVDGYFMMSSPWASLIICILYVFVVEYALPKFMENRKAYVLRTPMLIYNFAMVILSGYTFLEVAAPSGFLCSARQGGYSEEPAEMTPTVLRTPFVRKLLGI